MSDYLSVTALRNLAENMREAIADRDAKAMQHVGMAMVKMVDTIPEGSDDLYSEVTHFVMPRGRGEVATARERAMKHVNMCHASIDVSEIASLAPAEEKKDAAQWWIPAILSDLFALADEHKLDILTLLAKAQEQRESNT